MSKLSLDEHMGFELDDDALSMVSAGAGGARVTRHGQGAAGRVNIKTAPNLNLNIAIGVGVNIITVVGNGNTTVGVVDIWSLVA